MGSQRSSDRLTRGIVVIAFALIVTSCSSSPSSTPTTRHTNSSAKSEIKAAFVQFFAGSTPVSKKVALLQNGSQFESLIASMATSSIAKSLSIAVSRIKLVSSKLAKVTYTLYLGTTPALKNATGEALYEAGHWKVGDQSFCALLALDGEKPAACAS